VLNEADLEFLRARGHRFAVYDNGGNSLLVLEAFELPPGYTPAAVDLLIEIPSTYPDGALDMWWVYPDVRFASGREPDGATVRQPYPAFTPDPARTWQRFSRHPVWRYGTDDLRSYLGTVYQTMAKEARAVA
jgi:hypothetical protein